MTVTWTLELHCKSCDAYITYDSEIPEIKHDRNNIIINNRARKFVHDHPIYEEELNTLENVRTFRKNIASPKIYVVDELPEKYTLCPVCAERIYFE